MKRFIEWCRDYNRRYYEKHPHMRKARRMIARFNGLVVTIAGFGIGYIVVFEKPHPTSGLWNISGVVLALLYVVVGFAFFIWSFKMQDQAVDDKSTRG